MKGLPSIIERRSRPTNYLAAASVLCAVVLVALSVVLTALTQASTLGRSTLFSPLPTTSPLPTPTPTLTPTPTRTPVPSPTPRPPAPVVSKITPNHGPNDESIPIVIEGAHFSANPSVNIGQSRAAVLAVQAGRFILALVPAGLEPGVRSVRVCNPDFQCGQLPSAYTVTEAGPALSRIAPNSGRNDVPTEVSVYGRNLQPGIVMTIGELRLRSVVWIGPTRVDAIVPPGLPAGTHDVIARNLAADHATTLQQAYTAVERSRDDFSISEDDIWTLPRAVHAGGRVKIGANIHRQGGDGPKSVTVAFYRGNPTTGGSLLGRDTTQPIPHGDGHTGVAAISLDSAGEPGEFEVFVVIDPDDQMAEVSETNNVASRRVVVRPPARDEQPPQVTGFAVNGGQSIVTSRDISLTLRATDTGGSGVRFMALVEWEFRFGASQWVATHRTGWLPYAENFSHKLEPHGGARVLEAWVADGAGNISPNTGRAAFAYLPVRDSLTVGGVRSYLQDFGTLLRSANHPAGAQDQTVTLLLQTSSGDADLYVWSPDLGQTWSSAEADTADDQVSFTVSQTGTYIIEVTGYLESEFTLSVEPGSQALVSQPSHANSKPARDLPALLPQNQPPEESVVTSDAPQIMRAYLPIAEAPAQFQMHEAFLPLTVHEPELTAPETRLVFVPVVMGDWVTPEESQAQR